MFGARWRSDGSVEQGERLVLEERMGIFFAVDVGGRVLGLIRSIGCVVHSMVEG